MKLNKTNLVKLFRKLKTHIGDDFRASEDDTAPSMQVTIAWDGKDKWTYQTGDNSYTGSAYSYKHWAVVSLYRRSNSKLLARDVLQQLDELTIY